MERTVINTGLDSFIMPDSILLANDTTLVTEKTLGAGDICEFILIETLAQTGALHVRYLSDFNKHAFLLKINGFSMNVSVQKYREFRFTCVLQSFSKTACAYKLGAEAAGTQVCEGDFLFATVPYDNRFDKDILENHYRKVFTCLTEKSKCD